MSGGMVYQWRPGTQLSIDAQQVGIAIDTLAKKANAPLAPSVVVDAARDPKSPLHGAFEWDDTVAAAKHREEQARYLIGALVVTVKPQGESHDIRAFVNVKKDSQQGYMPLHKALSDAELRAQVLTKAWNELEAWQKRYSAYSELAATFNAINQQKKAA